MARKYVKGYNIEDIKVGMKIRDKGDIKTYGVIKSIEDIHNVLIHIFSNDGKRIGIAFYCFDKRCEFEYDGGKIDIVE